MSFFRSLLGRGVALEVIAHSIPLTDGTLDRLEGRLQAFLDTAVRQNPQDPELKRKLRRVAFVVQKDGRLLIDPNKILKLYHLDDLIDVIIKTRRRLEEREVDQVGEIFKRRGMIAEVRNIEEGCTEITARLTRGEAKRLEVAFARGDLAAAAVIAVRTRPVPEDPRRAEQPEASRELFETSWRRALRRAKLLRHWRRLRWVFSPAIQSSPLAHVFQESESHSYASAGIGERWPQLKADLRTSFLWWPVLTAASLALTLLGLQLIEPSTPLGFGIISGVVLSLSGAQVCASVISPLGVGAGGIGLGYAFGLANALAVGAIGLSGPISALNIQQDPFTAVTGGIVGLAAPQWLGSQMTTQAILILGAIATTIIIAGWLMGQARRAAGPERRRFWRDVTAALCGSTSGAGIAAVYGLTVLLRSQGMTGPAAFIVSFALVGGSIFALTVWLKTRDWRKSICFALGHVGISGLLCYAALGNVDRAFMRVVALSAATGWYHATWFTAAFVIGGMLGSVRAATLATALEGAGKFVGFVLVWMLRG